MKIVLAVVLLVSIGACRTAPPGVEPSDGPPTALAERPEPLPSDLSPSPRPASTGSPGSGAGGSDGQVRGGAGSRSPVFRTVGSITDAADDAGARTPGYADLRAIRIEDDGHSARITVDVGLAFPDPMPPGEQIAVGVDLYRRDTPESDHQVYAQGTADGWLAYLTTPEGVVDYPGSFALGGARMVFTVPWASLGGLRGSRFSAYTDWDREQPVVNAAGSDRAPEDGTGRFAR